MYESRDCNGLLSQRNESVYLKQVPDKVWTPTQDKDWTKKEREKRNERMKQLSKGYEMEKEKEKKICVLTEDNDQSHLYALDFRLWYDTA